MIRSGYVSSQSCQWVLPLHTSMCLLLITAYIAVTLDVTISAAYATRALLPPLTSSVSNAPIDKVNTQRSVAWPPGLARNRPMQQKVDDIFRMMKAKAMAYLAHLRWESRIMKRNTDELQEAKAKAIKQTEYLRFLSKPVAWYKWVVPLSVVITPR